MIKAGGGILPGRWGRRGDRRASVTRFRPTARPGWEDEAVGALGLSRFAAPFERIEWRRLEAP